MLKTIAAWAGLGLAVAIVTTALPAPVRIAAYAVVAVPFVYRAVISARAGRGRS